MESVPAGFAIYLAFVIVMADVARVQHTGQVFFDAEHMQDIGEWLAYNFFMGYFQKFSGHFVTMHDNLLVTGRADRHKPPRHDFERGRHIRQPFAFVHRYQAEHRALLEFVRTDGIAQAGERDFGCATGPCAVKAQDLAQRLMGFRHAVLAATKYLEDTFRRVVAIQIRTVRAVDETRLLQRINHRIMKFGFPAKNHGDALYGMNEVYNL